MPCTMRTTLVLLLQLYAVPGWLAAQNYVWSLLAPASVPPHRSGSAIVFDGSHHRAVMFGGFGTLALLNDTWEWDGVTWGLRATAVAPSPRYSHAMAFDAARQRVVLFGGTSGGGETWEWDGGTWLQRAPAHSPSPRFEHAMAYDPLRQRVMLFGGAVGSDETWEWDGTDWQLQNPVTRPPGRQGHAMVYDPMRTRIVLFGGAQTSMGGTLLHFADTWEWDGSSWSARFTTSYPPPRTAHAMAYDEARQRVVLFGGYNFGGFLGDTWELGQANWLQLLPALSPTPRSQHVMTYDENTHRTFMFGGSYGSLIAESWINGPPPVVASAAQYGQGCGVPALALAPVASSRPLLGQSAAASIANAPTPVAGVAIGWSNQFYGPFILPVTLAGIGMVGCDLLQSTDVFGLTATPVTSSTLLFSMGIPNQQSLLGAHVFLQAYCFAPGVNPLQLIASNGIDWTLGDI